MVRVTVAFLFVCCFATHFFAPNLYAQAVTTGRFIVQFNEAPLARTASTGKRGDLLTIQRIHDRFSSDLESIMYELQAHHAEQALIARSYTTVFNGVLLEGPERLEVELRSLPYIKRVYRDGVVKTAGHDIEKTLIETTNREHGRNRVELEEFSGAGIVVGVIDSGIDYNHPALGGGFGDGFKVMGGYDFVDNDQDPLDQNGHGTHVAGLVAGQSATFEGAAPGAQLMALRVLDRNGIGFDSNVIAALEYALDPDGDPRTDDAVDVINMSLSSLVIGDIDHPVSQAVEQAIEAGVVCVVAAGNRGEDGRATITVPGNAPRAITVGASNRQGAIAPFSSQGPSGTSVAFTEPRLGVKPDIIAPGVDIRSTWLQQGFRSQDGTSMASPWVAGLAARLKEQFPAWTPAMIKAWLMQPASDLGADVWKQGAGGINLEEVRSFIAYPSNLDFGVIPSTEPTWDTSLPLRILNLDTVDQEFRLRIKGVLPAGVTTSFSTTTITLSPGAEREIAIQLRATPASIPTLVFPDGYAGFVEISNGFDVVDIPLSFFKTPAIHLESSEAPDRVILQGTDLGTRLNFDTPGRELYVFVEPNLFDIVAQFDAGRRTVIREGIDSRTPNRVTISSEEAIHEITVRGMDAGSQPLKPLAFTTALKNMESDWTVMTELDLQKTEDQAFFISEVGKDYILDIRMAGFSEGDYYELPFSIINGIQADLELRNEATDLHTMEYRYSFSEDDTSGYFIPWTTREHASAEVSLSEDDLGAHAGFVFSSSFEQRFITMARPHEAYTWRHYGHSIVKGSLDLASETQTLILSAPVYVANDAAMIQTSPGQAIPRWSLEKYVEIHADQTGGYWAGMLNNSASNIRVEGPQEGGLFRGTWGEQEQGMVVWEMKNGAETIIQDTLVFRPSLLPGEQSFSMVQAVSPGPYTLTFTETATLLHKDPFRRKVELGFVTNRADPNPPRINRLYTAKDEYGEEHLVVDIVDVCAWCVDAEARRQVEEVRVFTYRDTYAGWIEEAVIDQQGIMSVKLTEGGMLENETLQIYAEDTYGNWMRYTVGIHEGDAAPIPVHNERLFSSVSDAVTQVGVVFPNPVRDEASLEYRLYQDTPVVIEVYDALGRQLTQKRQRPGVGTHRHVLSLSRYAAGLYFVKVHAEDISYVQHILKVN